jgi:hypothetical protein
MKPRKSSPSDSAYLKQAIGQTLGGQAYRVDTLLGGQSGLAIVGGAQEKPCRMIDGRPVYHVAKNKPLAQLPDFDVQKVHRWGDMIHPRVILSSDEISGSIVLYVDTRVTGVYLLWTATRVPFLAEGPAYEVIAWTPKTKGDSVVKAGFRLFHAAFLEMVMCPEDRWHCDPTMAEGFEGSERACGAMGAVAPNLRAPKSSLAVTLAKLPEYLRPLYEQGSTVTKDVG